MRVIKVRVQDTQGPRSGWSQPKDISLHPTSPVGIVFDSNPLVERIHIEQRFGRVTKYERIEE